MKPKKCRICKEPFTPWNTLTKVCSPVCAVEFARIDAKKKARRELIAFKKRNKSKPQLLKEAQISFNKYVRERDKDLPCISCGEIKDEKIGGGYDCGHYYSVGAHPSVRFSPDNGHKQCKKCNSFKSGNLHYYRLSLIAKIGEKAFNELEQEAYKVKNWTRQELVDIKREFDGKYKELNNVR